MIILDTDYVTLLAHGGADGIKLRALLADQDPNDVATTVITYEEQTRGWMSLVARAKSVSQQVNAYNRLLVHLENYRRIHVLPFDEAAATCLQRLRNSHLRVGTMDLKIAAIVLARDATLLSRNVRDFKDVPGLRVDNWLNGS